MRNFEKYITTIFIFLDIDNTRVSSHNWKYDIFIVISLFRYLNDRQFRRVTHNKRWKSSTSTAVWCLQSKRFCEPKSFSFTRHEISYKRGLMMYSERTCPLNIAFWTYERTKYNVIISLLKMVKISIHKNKRVLVKCWHAPR